MQDNFAPGYLSGQGQTLSTYRVVVASPSPSIPQLHRSRDPAEGKRLAQAASQLGKDFAADRGPAAQGGDRHHVRA